MPRLPQPGADAGQWGQLLNEYLGQSLTAEGALKGQTVGALQLVPQSISEDKLDPAVQAKLNTDVSGSYAYTDVANTFTEPQTFDPADSFHIGTALKVKYTNGFAGQRMHLTGQTVGDMPYIEVVPTTKTGTDPGGSVAGIQVYNTTYGGNADAPEREFIALEAKGDLYSGGRMFRLGTWASGAGAYLPFRIGIGSLNLVDFTSSGTSYGQIELLSKTRIYSLGATIDNMIDFQRGTSFKALRGVVAASSATPAPSVFLGRTRGTIGTPTNLASGDRVGSVHFGSYAPGTAVSDASEEITAYMRAETRESYSDFANKRGSQLTFGVTQVGTTTLTDAFRIADPVNADEVGLFVLVNRAGTKTLSRVTVGPADSAGTGYRTLRVAN